jgi:sn-glycerol 3-phosphate transport system ATP-binding protein
LAAISVEGVSKHWAAARAVEDISFEVEAGSFAVLLGPSGCGKSTTLRLIAGLESVSSGRVLIGGVDVTELPPAKRHISMVFQSYALFPHLSVAENILFGLKVRKVSARDQRLRLAKTAELLGLSELLQRKPSQLSGGQQQRVALGRAIIAETPVCLMDEPLSNLDAQLRHDMRREIRALQQALGVTMVYVTHDQTEAMSMADRVILLREGRVVQDAAPADLYASPATVFAARFIGTPPMNIVALADGAQGAVIKGTRGRSIYPGGGDGLLLGVRPEDIQLAASGVAATLEAVEYLGADSILACRAGSEALIVRAQGKVTLAPGATVQLGWQREAMHVFDAARGTRRDDVLAAARAAA